MPGIVGTWDVTSKSFMGTEAMVWTFREEGGRIVGDFEAAEGDVSIGEVTVTGNTVSLSLLVKKPFNVTAPIQLTLDGDTFSGQGRAKFLPGGTFDGVRRTA